MKNAPNNRFLALLAVATFSVSMASADTLTRNDRDGTGNWSASSDDAVFNNINQTVTLTEAITGGRLTMSNDAAVTEASAFATRRPPGALSPSPPVRWLDSCSVPACCAAVIVARLCEDVLS